MKKIYFIVILTILGACTKDKVRNPYENKFLILQVGENFEGLVQYDLNQPNASIENLACFNSKVEYGIESTRYYQSALINDTIFSIGPSNAFKYYTDFIPAANFVFQNENISYEDENFVQIISSTEIQFQEIWSKVSNLEIVKQFKQFNPNEKIGISKLIISEYDDLLEFNTQKVKYFIYLVN